MRNLINYCTENKIDIVFFDFFDTIVHRRVNPEYTKRMWSKYIMVALGIEKTVDYIYDIRINTEQYLRKKNQQLGFDDEYTYMELISEIYEILICNDVIRENDINYQDFYGKCLLIESNIELKVQYLNSDFIQTVVELKEKKIMIGCISDFYLSKETISEFMEYHNIRQYFSCIYVSSDYRLSKHSGRLYEVVIDNIEFKKILMVGDNRYSDIEMAKTNGLDTYWIEDKKVKKRYTRHMKDTKSTRKTSRRLMTIANGYTKDRESFKNYAFSLYLFTARLYSMLIKKGIKDVFFLSREGEYLKKLFDIYKENQLQDNGHSIHTHYLMVSRGATFLASLKELELEEFNTLFRQYNNICLFDFLHSITFNEDEIKMIALELKVDAVKEISDFRNSDIFKKLKENISFTVLYNKKRQEQHNNFILYLQSFGVDFEKDGLNLVDVGWKGTMQDNISDIIGKNTTITGYYLGLNEKVGITKYNRKIGVLFSAFFQNTVSYYVFSQRSHFYEIILKASHGRASAYIRDVNGKTNILLDNDKDVLLYNGYVKGIQSLIMIVFNQILDLFSESHFNHEDFIKDILKIHFNMINFPTSKSNKGYLNAYKYHTESFGDTQEKIKFKHNRGGWKVNIKNMKSYLRDKGVLLLYLKGLLQYLKVSYLRYYKRIRF